MTSVDIKRLALVFSVQAEIDGMKSFNAERLSAGMAPGYDQSHFDEKAEELRLLAAKHDDQI